MYIHTEGMYCTEVKRTFFCTILVGMYESAYRFPRIRNAVKDTIHFLAAAVNVLIYLYLLNFVLQNLVS